MRTKGPGLAANSAPLMELLKKGVEYKVHRQALAYDRFFFTYRFLRSKDGMVGRLALLLGSGLSSEVNKKGSPPS